MAIPSKQSNTQVDQIAQIRESAAWNGCHLNAFEVPSMNWYGIEFHIHPCNIEYSKVKLPRTVKAPLAIDVMGLL
jgi:hypothetical protein